MRSPRSSVKGQAKIEGRRPKTKAVQNLLYFLNQVCLAESSIDMVRHRLSQSCPCLCNYAKIFNIILGVTQIYDRDENNQSIGNHSRCDRYELLSKTKGVIDVEDIMAVCRSKYNYEYESSRYAREVLINYIGLQHINGVINFKQFIAILQPRYAVDQQQGGNEQERASNTSSQTHKILGILTKIKQDLSAKVEKHSNKQYHLPSSAQGIRIFTQYIQWILHEHTHVEQSLKQMIENSTHIYEYLDDRQLINGGVISRQAIRQLLHEFDAYSHGKYIRICNYIFGSEELINFHCIVPVIQLELPAQNQQKRRTPTADNTKQNKCANINNSIATSSSYSKLQTCQLMDEIDDISSKYQLRQNSNNIKQQNPVTNDKNQNKVKQSYIGTQINSKIDEQLNKILTDKLSSNKENKNNKEKNINHIKDNGQNKNKEFDVQRYGQKQGNKNLSEASLRIKQIEARAMLRYQEEKYNRIVVGKQQRQELLLQQDYYLGSPTYFTQLHRDLQLDLFLKRHLNKYENFEPSPYTSRYRTQLDRQKIIYDQVYDKQHKIEHEKNQLHCIKNGNFGRIRTQF